MNIKLCQTITIFSLAAFSIAACAAPNGNRPPPPPQAAFDACQNKNEGDTVTFEVEGKTMDGTCMLKRGTLIAVPDGHGHREHLDRRY